MQTPVALGQKLIAQKVLNGKIWYNALPYNDKKKKFFIDESFDETNWFINY